MKRPKRDQQRDRSQSFEDFLKEVKEKSARKARARREEELGIWYGIAMIGIIGWSVAIPTLIGVAIGLWIDRQLSDPFPWTLLFVLIGVALGCLNAWYWVQHEIRED